MFRALGLVFLVNLFLIFFPLLDFFNLFEDASSEEKKKSFAIAAVTVFNFLLTYGYVLWLLWRSFKAAKRFSRPGIVLDHGSMYAMQFIYRRRANCAVFSLLRSRLLGGGPAHADLLDVAFLRLSCRTWRDRQHGRHPAAHRRFGCGGLCA